MTKINELVLFLEQICPLQLAEDWDNVGLILGDRNREVRNAATCLTITLNVVEEAVQNEADIIVSHHPFPFLAAKKWTTDSVAGKILLKLLESKIAVFSPHTAHDSALWGINRQLAALLNLRDVRPMFPPKNEFLSIDSAAIQGLDGVPNDLLAELVDPDRSTANLLGTGRIGTLEKPTPLSELVRLVKQKLNVATLLRVGDENRLVQKVAIGCGSAGEFISQAVRLGADVFLTGEARFHDYLDAEQNGLALILPGHFATERFAMKTLADRIAARFPSLDVWTARSEIDPVSFC